MKSQSTTTQLITITLLLAIFVQHSAKPESIQYLDSEWKSFIQLRNVAIESQNSESQQPANVNANIEVQQPLSDNIINSQQVPSENQSTLNLQNEIMNRIQILRQQIQNEIKTLKENLVNEIDDKLQNFKSKVSQASQTPNSNNQASNDLSLENNLNQEDPAINSNLFTNAYNKAESAKNEKKKELSAKQNQAINDIKDSVQNNQKKPINLKATVGDQSSTPATMSGNLRKGSANSNINVSASSGSDESLTPDEEEIFFKILDFLVRDSIINNSDSERLRTVAPLASLNVNQILETNRGKKLLKSISDSINVSPSVVQAVLLKTFDSLLANHNQRINAIQATTQTS